MIITVMVIGSIPFLIYKLREPSVELQAGTVLEKPAKIAEFGVVDHNGKPFDGKSLEGRWTLLFSGFTHCPDICPTTLAMMAELDRRLGENAPQFVFVSVDPARDTPERLAAYLGHFGPAFIGLTGSPERIAALTRGLGLAQVKIPGVRGEYTVDHSTALMLIDPRVRLAGYFQPPHDIDALEADLAALPGS